jgi:adenine phosphoribosyltransferase
VSFFRECAMDLVPNIRTVDDFPKPGVKFLDVTSILEDPLLFRKTIKWFVKTAIKYNVESIVGVDARGFIWASTLASELQVPLYLARKPGKLPGEVVTETYDTEYSTASLSMLKNVNIKGPVMVVDDILATGGTLKAVGNLLNKHWNIEPSQQVHAVLVELGFLPGTESLKNLGYNVQAIDRLD